MKQAQQDMKALIDQQSRTAQERAELQAALDKEAEDRRKVEEQQRALQDKLKNMEEKLIKGGEVISKASQQEALLRKAEQELRERKIQEATLARELAVKEEANLQLEEHFSSLQEEVEVKTKKLKKLWNKYQAAIREANDLQEEFQTERTDMLDTIRQLTQTLKLKDLIIANFIPEDYSKAMEKRAVFNQEDDSWAIPKLDLSGNALRSNVTRPVSSTKLRRPETEFARQRKQFDNNPRYKYDNILSLDLDPSEKTTQEFAGPGMKSKVDMVLAMDINGDEGEDVTYEHMQPPISSPYLSYGNNAAAGGAGGDNDDRSIRPSEKSARPKTGKKKSESSGASGSGSGSGGGSKSRDRDMDNMSYGGDRERDRGDRDRERERERERDRGTYTGSGSGGGSSGASSRPKSASRRREGESTSTATSKSNERYMQEDENVYPTARGLIRK
jgi:kinesin family protein 3/17